MQLLQCPSNLCLCNRKSWAEQKPVGFLFWGEHAMQQNHQHHRVNIINQIALILFWVQSCWKHVVPTYTLMWARSGLKATSGKTVLSLWMGSWVLIMVGRSPGSHGLLLYIYIYTTFKQQTCNYIHRTIFCRSCEKNHWYGTADIASFHAARCLPSRGWRMTSGCHSTSSHWVLDASTGAAAMGMWLQQCHKPAVPGKFSWNPNDLGK